MAGGAGKAITPRRLARMRAVLERRQPDLTVVIENVHDPFNASALLRSCDAVGIAEAHLVYTVEEVPDVSLGVSASARRWMTLQQHPTIDACYAHLRERGFTIYATYLGEGARDLYDLDLTGPCAFVFGNEARGVTPEARVGADAAAIIPMMGMVESLNISAACAVTLYEALRQRRQAGRYDTPRWDAAEIDQRLRVWLEREGRDVDAALDGGR
jgi:tRNA (guanosine-2'-O-)-methyltransferase